MVVTRRGRRKIDQPRYLLTEALPRGHRKYSLYLHAAISIPILSAAFLSRPVRIAMLPMRIIR